eukprot:gene47246-biopygen3646
MTPEEGILTDLTPHDGVIALGDKDLTLQATAVGRSRLSGLGKFLLVPQLTFSLISVPALDNLGYRSVFENGEVLIFLNKVLVISGTLRQGLYYLDPRYVQLLIHGEQPGESQEQSTLE